LATTSSKVAHWSKGDNERDDFGGHRFFGRADELIE